MTRIRLSTLIFCFALASASVGAAEQTLRFQVVAHIKETKALSVPGRAGHKVGIAAFHGLAIMENGDIAQHWYSGSFDFVDGAGRIHGYAQWTFEDKSQLNAAYVGEAKAAPDGGITFDATYSNVTGTGRFAGVRGKGSFAGRRFDPLKGGGDTYFRGTLALTRTAQ